jgi:NADPH oxidase
MGFWNEFKAQTRGTKLLFNILFHGFHIGLFVLGWYVASFEEAAL